MRESERCEGQNSKDPATEPRSKAGLRERLTHPDVFQLLFRTRTGKWNLSACDLSVADKALYVQHGDEAMSRDSQAKRDTLRNGPSDCQQPAPPGSAPRFSRLYQPVLEQTTQSPSSPELCFQSGRFFLLSVGGTDVLVKRQE